MMLWASIQSVLAQEGFTCEGLLESETSSSYYNACEVVDIPGEEIDGLPRVTVYVNVHFVKHHPYGNFEPLNDWSPLDGINYAKLMLSECNNLWSNLIPSPTSQANFLGDSKFRFQLYSEPDNSQDLYGGIWFWETLPAQLPYGSKVLHIIMSAKNSNPGNACFCGAACGLNLCNRIYLYDAYFHAAVGYPASQWQWWAYAKLLNHEFGHIAGLCHAFFCGNDCAGVDLDPVLECNNNGLCANSCGFGSSCNPWSSGSTNVMGYNGASQSLTPCQWNIMMRQFINKQPKFASFCDDPADPLIIPGGTTVVWDKIKVMNRDVILEPMAELIIRCKVYMGPTRSIHVKRGSRLKVEAGASITNLCKDKSWQGIYVYGNNSISHTVGMLEGPLSASNPGIVIMTGADISHAVNAISCNPPAPWPDVTGYWNGLVVCSGTTFRNNRRSVELMLSNKTTINPDGTFGVTGPNLVLTAFTNCRFLNENGSARRGITNWAANGIVVENCEFSDMTEMGLQTWDAGVSVLSSKFKGNLYGIHITSTAPLLSSQIEIGLKGKGNRFEENAYGIYATSIEDAQIAYNEFSGNFIGQYFEGNSQYITKHNHFSTDFAGIVNTQTQNGMKQAICNIYQNTRMGIVVQGNNESFRFINEDFSTHLDVLLTDYGTAFPGILPNMGTLASPAINLFTEGTNDRLVTAGITNAFSYIYKEGLERNRPYCSINDNTGFGGVPCISVNNFYSIGYPTDKSFECQNRQSESGSEITEAALNHTRNEIAALQGQPDSEPQISALTAQKEQIVYSLTKQWLTEGLFNKLDTLFTAEGDWARRFGLRVLQGQWEAAAQILDELDTQKPEEAAFEQVQRINLERLRKPGYYVPSATSLSVLEQIAEGATASAAYAKALLGVFDDRIFLPDVPSVVLERSRDRDDQINASVNAGGAIRLVPNPAANEITLQLPDGHWLSASAQIHVVSASGIYARTVTLGDNHTLTMDIGDLTPGMYFVILLDAGRIWSRAKLLVIKH